MSFTVTTALRENRQLAVTIEVSQDQVERELRKAAAKVASEFRIPGFRKGKAPYHIIVQQYGLASLYSEFVDDLGQKLFVEALEQEGIAPYAQSSLEDVAFEPLTYKLVVPLEPEIILGDYKSLRLEKIKPAVDEAEVERWLEGYRSQHAGWQDVDRPSDYGDRMTIDVKSVIVPAEGEADAGETVVLEESDWDVTPDQENPMEPPGFDAELIGMRVDEAKEFLLGWPTDSQSIYAGKTARFVVKVKVVQAYEKPELTDDLAKMVNPDFETIEDLKRNIREKLGAGETSRLQNELIEQALDAIVDMSTLNYPPVVIEDQIEGMLQSIVHRLRQLGIDSFDEFLRRTNQSIEAYREQLRPAATKIARRNLVLSELVKAENLTVGDAEIEERIQEMFGADSEDTAETLTESLKAVKEILHRGVGRNVIASRLLTHKAITRLLVMVGGEEVDGPPADAV